MVKARASDSRRVGGLRLGSWGSRWTKPSIPNNRVGKLVAISSQWVTAGEYCEVGGGHSVVVGAVDYDSNGQRFKFRPWHN